MIIIKRNTECDTRTCDVTKVTKDKLLENSKIHIEDVKQGMAFFAEEIVYAGSIHDHSKISHIDQFYDDFTNGFKEGHQAWWKMHQLAEKHHLKNPEYVQDDVNLIDILEMITDGVMAGLSRSGEYRKEEIPDSLLRKAFDNTIELLLKNVEVKNE